MKGISIMLLFIATLDGIATFTVEIHKYNQNWVEISNFRWPADATSMRKIPDESFFKFHNAEVDILPQNFTDKFEKCNSIIFFNGVVKTIHINPKLINVVLERTATENITIKRGKYYQLERLECTDARLKSVPENINQLKKLKYLVLSNNLIETVQLDQLNAFNNLIALVLKGNDIKHIYSHGLVSLPSLVGLQLERNQLKHVDVCSWIMPSLVDLFLAGNNLTHFAINHLPGLKRVTMNENPIYCAWFSLLSKGKPRIKFEDGLSCDKESEGVFVLDCPSTIDHLKQQNSNFNSRLAVIEQTVLNNSQQFAAINKRFQNMEELLKNLSGKVIDLQNVSNDIIEAFYRSEIERTSQNNRNP
nr:leucine-rich repeat-containing protein 40-like [Aedes albopictus]